jgi:hypothetical protein
MAVLDLTPRFLEIAGAVHAGETYKGRKLYDERSLE